MYNECWQVVCQETGTTLGIFGLLENAQKSIEVTAQSEGHMEVTFEKKNPNQWFAKYGDNYGMAIQRWRVCESVVNLGN